MAQRTIAPAAYDQLYSNLIGFDMKDFIVAALNRSPQDRSFMLILEQVLASIVLDPRILSFPIVTNNPYHQFLIHHVAAFFGFDHWLVQNGPLTAVVVSKSFLTRLPSAPFASYIQPSFTDNANGLLDGSSTEAQGQPLHQPFDSGTHLPSSQRGSNVVGECSSVGLVKCESLVKAYEMKNQSKSQGRNPLEQCRGVPVQYVVQTMTKSTNKPKSQDRIVFGNLESPKKMQSRALTHQSQLVDPAIGKQGPVKVNIEQVVIRVDKFEKKEKLQELISADKDDKGCFTNKTLVFVGSNRMADFLAIFLSQELISATSIHSDREHQEVNEALSEFRDGVRAVLVVAGDAFHDTEILGVDHVINFDLPKDIGDYIQRIAYAHRLGNRGRATSFYDKDDDSQIAQSLLMLLTIAYQRVPDWLLKDALEIGGNIGANFEESSKAFLRKLQQH